MALYAFMNRIFLISIFLYLLGHFAVKLYIADIDMINISPKQSETLWLLGLVRDIGFSFFCSLIIVHPIFKLNSVKDKKYIKHILFGLVFNLAFIGFAIYMAFKLYQIPTISNNLIEQRPELIGDYQKLLNSNEIEVGELAERANLMAKLFFEDSGVIVNVIDKDGKQVEYVPSKESIKKHRDLLQADALIKHQAKSMKIAAITNFSILLLSILIGLLSNRALNTYNKAFKKTDM